MRKPKVVPAAPADLRGRRVCGNCYLFERFPDAQQPRGKDIAGECMLNPPKVHGYTELEEDGVGSPIQSRPLVYFHERCGQHRPQEH